MTRKQLNSGFRFLSSLASLICAFILVFLISLLCIKGMSAINFDFILTESKNFGAEGGIRFQISGSLLLVLTTALLSFPIGLGTAIYLSEYLNDKLKPIFNLFIYSLNGIPSIIFGLVGLIFFVNMLNTGVSWFVGSIILAIMILPTIILSTFQSINSVPEIYRESAKALGLSKWQVIRSVLIPHGLKGATTGLLMGMARAVGETAPIMFIATAFSGVGLPNGLLEPVSALPTHILSLAQQAANPNALNNAWAASFVLLCIVLIFSLSAYIFRFRTQSILLK